MQEKLKNHRADFLLGAYCLLLAAVKVALAFGEGLELKFRVPRAWLHLYSADQLWQGHWLGPLKSLVLSAHPGYSFWVACNHGLGIPLRVGSEILLVGSACLFVWALRKVGVGRVVSGLLFALVLLDPIAKILYSRPSPLTLSLPLILTAGSCYLLSTYQERSRFKWLLWLIAGMALAAYWISLSSFWIPIVILMTLLAWELALPKASGSKLAGAGLLALTLCAPAVLADLSIRSMNQAEYGQFLLQRKPRNGLGESVRLRDSPRPEDLLRRIALSQIDAELPKNIEIHGWAADRLSPIREIELWDDRGKILEKTGSFRTRVDVHHFLRREFKWGNSPLQSGFFLAAGLEDRSKENLSLIFRKEDGSVTAVPLQNFGTVGEDFRYDIESVEIQNPAKIFWASIYFWIDAVFRLLVELSCVALVLVGILAAIRKLAGDREDPADFWLLFFSMLIPVFLFNAVTGDSQGFDLLSPPGWPLATLICFQMILLLQFLSKPSPGNFLAKIPGASRLAKWRVEWIFLVLALAFGGFSVFANPPFQAADESTHAFRAFQTSQFQPASASVPVSVLRLLNRFDHLPFHPQNKTSPQEIWEAFDVPLQPADRAYLGSIGVSFIPFVPPAIGVFLGRLFELPTLAVIYLGRLSNLAVWIGLIFFAIRRLPFFKWVFFFLALSPMAVYLSSSLSHDPFTIGISFLLIASFLSHAYGPQDRLSNRHILGLVVLGALASIAKVLYFPLILLYFWIPIRKLGSRWRYFAGFALLLGVSLAVDLLWNLEAGTVKRVVTVSAKPVFGTKAFIFNHPWEFLELVGRTLRHYYSFYLEGFVGRLGWLDTGLPIGLLLLYGILLLYLARQDRSEGIQFGWPKKLWGLSVFLSVAGLLFVVFFLTWTRSGSAQIDGIQGRYFIPIAPLFLLIFYDNRRKSPRPERTLYWAPVAAFIILLISTAVMLNRYYFL